MIHSKAYNIYNNMLESYQTADVNENLTFDCTSKRNEMLFYLATELAKLAEPNPLSPEDPGFNEYEDILYFFSMWPDNKPNCAFKKRFMLAAYNLCKACPENIFKDAEAPVVEFSLEELKEKEYSETEEEDIATETYIPVTEPEEHEHIFGVVPFEDDEQHDMAEYYDQEEEKPHGFFHRNKKKNRR